MKERWHINARGYYPPFKENVVVVKDYYPKARVVKVMYSFRNGSMYFYLTYDQIQPIY